MICVVFVFSTIDFSAAVNTIIPSTIAEEKEPDDISEDSDTPSADKPMEEVKTFNNPWTLLNNAFNGLNKYDYKISYSQDIIGRAAGQSGLQEIDREVYNINKVAYVKTILKSDAPFGMGFDYIEYSIIDNSGVTTKNVKTNSTSSYTLSNYLATFGTLQSKIPYVINISTAIAHLDLNPSKDYYIVSVTLYEKAYANYLKTIAANGGSSPSIKSITLNIKIDKKYGNFRSITATESYEVTQFSQRAECTSTIKMNFTFNKNYSNTSQVLEIKNTLGVK
jgi:hypothetical protein